MDAHRCSPAEDLLYWRGELPELLRAARRHRTSTPATFTRGHAAAALEKTLAGLVGPDQLTVWAQAVHFEEEVDIDEAYQDLLTQFLVEISTPELFEPVTAETCRRWLHRIRTSPRSAADR
ncbi:hypothetical protein [Streptomyces radiopugnans]|uniref:Uncharacterized protein n=1 Tax=Streptomyces radiopugnans TaxID=403935 RepID=A0A1H9KL22_9ACTN|nr:hypothetical protein [Streptomyces radiopugnans]SEQ99840.1 hypothetical protein SAMN05216481_12527 [Streptomyces radiopugnans]